MLGSQVLDVILWSGLISLTVWLAVCWLFFVQLRLPAYHPFTLYLIYHFMGFIARPFAIYSQSYSFIWNRLGFRPWESDILPVTVVANLALIACAAGAFYVIQRRGRIETIPPTNFVVRRPLGLAIAAGAILAAGLYSTYRGYGNAGLESVTAFKTTADASGGQRLVDVSGYTLALSEGLPILCIILLFTRKLRPYGYVATALFVGLRLYIGAQRLSFVVVLSAWIFGMLINHRRRYPGAMLILAIIFGAFLFDFVGHDRYVLRRVFAGEAEVSSLWTTYLEDKSGESTAIDVVEYETAAAAIFIVNQHSGYSYGSQYLRILVWPIPRQLWRDKPVFTSTVNLEAYEFDFSYLTHSLYGDLYMTLGLPAVVLGMLLLGIIMARIYEMARVTMRPMAYTFFWVFFIYLNIVLRDGGVTFAFFWAFSMISAAILLMSGDVVLVREGLKATVRRPLARVRRLPATRPPGALQ